MVVDKYTAVVDGIHLMQLGDAYLPYTPKDINTYLLLPIQYDRIRLYYEGTKPVGLITWCWLPSSQSTLFLEDKYNPTESDYALENPGAGYDLWGLDFIAPYGHARRMMKAIRNEHKERYGTTKVHFRRFYDRHKLHRRTF